MFAVVNSNKMKFRAYIDIMPQKDLLDPQGKTIAKHMDSIDIHGVHDVRIGKRIEMVLEAQNEAEANEKIEIACKKLLANIIMEQYEFSLEALN